MIKQNRHPGNALGLDLSRNMFFDRIVVINLDSRPERLSRIAQRLAGREWERFPAIVPTDWTAFDNKGYAGATLSHLAVWKTIKTNTLILEDDAIWRDDAFEWLERIESQQKTVAWNIIYLGGMIWNRFPITKNLSRFSRGVHLHAYIVRADAISRLISCVEQELAKPRALVVDWALSQSPIQKLVCNPVLAVQEPGPSDTGGGGFRLHEELRVKDADEFFRHCSALESYRDLFFEKVTRGTQNQH